MRKYVHLLLALGILTANPVRSQAQGLLSGFGLSKSAQQQANQQKAEQVAEALKKAQLNGYDLSVEVRGDTAKITGKVRDVTHRVLAERAATSVAGVNRVLNELNYVPQGGIEQTSARYVDNSVRPATFYESAYGESASGVEQVHFQKPGKRASTSKKPSTQSSRQNRPMTQAQTSRPAMRVPDHQVQVVQQTSAPTPVPAPPIEIPVGQVKPKTAEIALPEPLIEFHEVEAQEVEAQEVAMQSASIETAAAVAPQTRPEPQGPSNQEVAQNIANSLAEIGLVNYDVEIRYENGQAMLAGDVATVQQLQAAGMVTSRVPGVREVDNQLKVMGPIAPTSYNAPMMPAGMPPVAMAGGMGGGMQAGPTAIAGAGNYSNPNLPSHAWPAYAAYPNSAAIQYPKQYSASAWPYIGPFYPYPQVPLGWREVSLQWDDGHWQLDFEKKQKAWYWLWNPKNWH